mgnify:CR=1 FL=1
MTEKENQTPPAAITIPGFHAIMESILLKRFGSDWRGAVLDVGAGHGAFSHRLKNLRYRVSACDMHEDLFQLPDVEFKTANVSEKIPWEDHTFDLVVALEITEHVDGLMTFFREANRILKPGGYFFFSTPNILSLKSRFRFLWTGFFYSFQPLADSQADSVIDHITPLPFHLYHYRLKQCGFTFEEVTTDKWQRSSFFGLLFYPWIRLCTYLFFPHSSLARQQNSLNCLLGRKLIVLARKTES